LSDHLSTELERPNSSFKKVLKDSLSQIRDKELIRGIRVNCSGRLGRAPMAKMEWFKFGSITSNKISANIDYSYSMGKTKYGSFGIKVWLYKS
jgi:small subunit ribosomal protein S3